MAGTYGDLKALIADDLRRSSLTTQVATAILDAIRDHDSERFWFNQTAVYTFNTATPSIDVYPVVVQAPIQEFIKIDSIRAQQAGVWYTVGDSDYDTIEQLYSIPSFGPPWEWAFFGNSIRLWPYPDKVYPLRVFGHYRIMPLIADADTNDWTTTAKNLIRYTALKRLYTFPIRNMDQRQIADDAGMTELNYLRRESERRAKKGQMEADSG